MATLRTSETFSGWLPLLWQFAEMHHNRHRPAALQWHVQMFYELGALFLTGGWSERSLQRLQWHCRAAAGLPEQLRLWRVLLLVLVVRRAMMHRKEFGQLRRETVIAALRSLAGALRPRAHRLVAADESPSMLPRNCLVTPGGLVPPSKPNTGLGRAPANSALQRLSVARIVTPSPTASREASVHETEQGATTTTMPPTKLVSPAALKRPPLTDRQTLQGNAQLTPGKGVAREGIRSRMVTPLKGGATDSPAHWPAGLAALADLANAQAGSLTPVSLQGMSEPWIGDTPMGDRDASPRCVSPSLTPKSTDGAALELALTPASEESDDLEFRVSDATAREWRTSSPHFKRFSSFHGATVPVTTINGI
jgi:hypothetical protein